MRTTWRLAVCGSKSSLVSDQNPESSSAPKAATCRYTITGTTVPVPYQYHSATCATALERKPIGTRTRGPTQDSSRE